MEKANLYDRVRSFDFPNVWDFPDPKDTSADPAPTHTTGFDLEGERACYVEGIVLAIIEPGETGPCGYVSRDCTRVCIKLHRRVFRGEEELITEPTFVSPPQNGLGTSFGGVCCGIEIIESFDRDSIEQP